MAGRPAGAHCGPMQGFKERAGGPLRWADGSEAETRTATQTATRTATRMATGSRTRDSQNIRVSAEPDAKIPITATLRRARPIFGCPTVRLTATRKSVAWEPRIRRRHSLFRFRRPAAAVSGGGGGGGSGGASTLETAVRLLRLLRPPSPLTHSPTLHPTLLRTRVHHGGLVGSALSSREKNRSFRSHARGRAAIAGSKGSSPARRPRRRRI